MSAAAVLVSRRARFLVECVDAGGRLLRGSLLGFSAVPFEDCQPVRSFPSFKGQRNFPGWWWSSTTGRLVGFESWLERDQLMQLDFDPTVVGVASQPLWLSWHDGRKARRHAPDYFVRLADGTGVLVDVRGDDRIPQRDAEAFASAAQACHTVGWSYRRVGGLAPVWLRNLRWLSRYRHPRHAGDPAVRAALLACFEGGAGLRAGAALAADPLVSLPVLFHLLWCQVLTADLAWAVLSSSTTVWPNRQDRP